MNALEISKFVVILCHVQIFLVWFGRASIFSKSEVESLLVIPSIGHETDNSPALKSAFCHNVCLAGLKFDMLTEFCFGKSIYQEKTTGNR